MYEIPSVPEVSHPRFYRFYSRFHDFTFSRLLKCVGHDLERLQGRVVGGSYGLSSAVPCCDVSNFNVACARLLALSNAGLPTEWLRTSS